MSQLRKWIVSLAETSAAAAFSYEWLDQPIALFFHKTVARPAAIVIVVLGIVNLDLRRFCMTASMDLTSFWPRLGIFSIRTKAVTCAVVTVL